MKLYPDVIELLDGLVKETLPIVNTTVGDRHLIPKRISKAQIKRALSALRQAQKHEEDYPALKPMRKRSPHINTEHDEC